MLNTKIEWCDSTWSPVVGCLHGCPYCYANRLVSRFHPKELLSECKVDDFMRILDEPIRGVFKSGRVATAAYPYGFEPTYLRYRLKELETKRFGKSIFVCSMSDLFGDWVPDWIIEEVLNDCLEHSEHIYLFLTKNPKRFVELSEKGKLPENKNFWYGSTMDTESRSVFYSNKHNTFLSVEPILKPFYGKENAERIAKQHDWIIFGAETGRRAEKVIPKKEWISDLVEAFRKEGKPVFMKDSMKNVWKDLMYTQKPWVDE